MKTMTATEAKTHFGKLLDDVNKGPISIEKNGRPVAVLSSLEEYEKRRSSEEEDADALHRRVMELHEESIVRWGKVYEALAK